MQYMLLIHQDFTREDMAALSDEDKQQLYAEWGEVNRTPGVTPGSELASAADATTVRSDNGETLVTDGPFPAIKEALAGWLTFEADDLDAAIELAQRIPAVRRGGAVEIRPLVQR